MKIKRVFERKKYFNFRQFLKEVLGEFFVKYYEIQKVVEIDLEKVIGFEE